MHAILYTDAVSRLWPVMADAAIKGALVLAAAGIVTGLLRAAPAALRHLLWTIALLIVLAMPALSTLVPAWSVLPVWTAHAVMAPAPPAPASPHLILPAFTMAYPQEPIASPYIAPPETQRPAPIAPLPTPWTWRDCAALAWIVSSALMLLPMAISFVNLWRLGRRSRRIEDPAWNDLLQNAARRLTLRRHVTLLCDAGRPMPMTWGIFRPKVLLPREALHWSPQRRQVVLLHELGHIKRWDCLTQLIAQAVRAVYWFNPLAWLAVARMLVERERACDDLVLTLGSKPSDYAEELLFVATAFQSNRLCAAAGVAMARSSRLEGRVRAILDHTRNHKRLTVLGSILAAALLIGGVLPVAALRSAAKASDQPPSTQPATPSAANPWRVTLPNGIGVELLGLCNHPSENKQWWKPDGSPLDPAPWHNYKANVSPQFGTKTIAREMAIRLTKRPTDPAFDVSYDMADSRASVTGNPPTSSDADLRFIAVTLPDEPVTAVRIGIATGPWRTIAEGGSSGDDATSTKDGEFIFAPFAEQNGNLVATISSDADMTSVNWRMVAAGLDGTEHIAGSIGTCGAGHLWQKSAIFQGLSPNLIKAIRLQTRPYQWAEFKNVALHPAPLPSPSAATPQATGQPPLTGDLPAHVQVPSFLSIEAKFERIETQRAPAPIIDDHEWDWTSDHATMRPDQNIGPQTYVTLNLVHGEIKPAIFPSFFEQTPMPNFPQQFQLAIPDDVGATSPHPAAYFQPGPSGGVTAYPASEATVFTTPGCN